MSNIYIKEPPTSGKVLLHTTMGDIDVELWSKEAPIACRNFVQLCMEGYYHNVIFHRIVAGFIVQGGDPTGTGTGGESIYGKPFKDEFHQRLRFVRRGLVAMANSAPNDNGSQFFFTLGPCNDLNKKHTIFGKVTGDTVYNMIRLGEVGTDDDERPINPPSIKWTKVLANPFEDIEPRVVPGKTKKEEKGKGKSQSRATKDYKLLSFGEEAEVDEEESTEFTFKGPKSSHDLAKDPRLSSTPAVTPMIENENGDHTVVEEKSSSPKSDDEDSSSEEEKNCKRNAVREKLKSKKRKIEDVKKTAENTDRSAEQEPTVENSKAEALRKESRKLARELAGKNKKKTEERNSSSDSDKEDITSNPMFAEYKAQQKIYRNKTSITKKRGSVREQETLALLNSFQSKMTALREEAGFNESDDEHTKEETPDNEEDDDNITWMVHKFKNDDALSRDAKDMNRDVNEDTYDIVDPRNPINKRRREKDKRESKDKSRRHKSDRSDSPRSRHHHHRR